MTAFSHLVQYGRLCRWQKRKNLFFQPELFLQPLSLAKSGIQKLIKDGDRILRLVVRLILPNVLSPLKTRVELDYRSYGIFVEPSNREVFL